MIQPTSLDAKREHDASGRTLSLRERVYRFIAGRGQAGATHEEVVHAIRNTSPDVSENAIRPRCVELSQTGKDGSQPKIKDSLVRRPTKSGRDAIVWILATPENSKQPGLF